MSQVRYRVSLVKRGGTSIGDVMAILKKAKALPVKYSRGGDTTNRLKELG